ncbi:hypothetical protein KVG96_08730 [Pseudomonas sp. COR58]|uniref:Uncharacterized protein n=1 Tax=Pseudomonas ekonensis TaxID=2842353 RepID=A0ABS6PCT1_9PSED|nr:hypothetical protein [Pseudomonas ekonensis]MBV4458029.1 hypothetical protein [Pseudomonas ekonensis]
MNNSMKASISYWNETFVGDNDFALRLVGDWYHLQARQDMPNGDYHYLDFRVPKSIADTGEPVTLTLVADPVSPEQGRGTYSRFSASHADILNSRSGVMLLSFDAQAQRMKGSFQFQAKLGETLINISEGSFDLTGITDGVGDATGRGTFTATSAWGDFRADEVSIELKEPPIDPSRYWEVVGRMEKATELPPSKSNIALIIKEHVNTGTHELKNNPDVRVSYFRSLEGIFPAVAGTLTLTSLPASGHAQGTLAADFMDKNDQTVRVTGDFDIQSVVGKTRRHHGQD